MFETLNSFTFSRSSWKANGRRPAMAVLGLVERLGEPDGLNLVSDELTLKSVAGKESPACDDRENGSLIDGHENPEALHHSGIKFYGNLRGTMTQALSAILLD
jgi:hypothetical protein